LLSCCKLTGADIANAVHLQNFKTLSDITLPYLVMSIMTRVAITNCVFAALVLISCSHHCDAATPLNAQPLDGLQGGVPSMPALSPSCNVLDWGAVGDNRTEDTAAVQAAVSNCSTVIFPPGAFLLRPIYIGGNNGLTIVVTAGAILVAWGDPDTWNATTGSVRPLLWADEYQNGKPAPLINFTLTGGGSIDGQGWRWWPYGKTRSRPILLDLSRVENLAVTNVTFIDSPSFHIQVRGDGIHIQYVTVHAGEGCEGYESAPNTDGINVGGTSIYIADSFVHNGDDCIPTNANWNGSDTYNMLVERVHCECGTNGGVVIGYGNTTLRDIVYRDMTVIGTNQGAGMKISEAYENVTAIIYNVIWQNITITNPRYAAMYINVFEEDANACFQPSNASRPDWLTAANLSFVDIHAAVNSSAGTVAGCFNCGPTRPCSNIGFSNVTVTDLGSAAPPTYTCFHVEVNDEGNSLPLPCGV
jgi:hypothetical protein